MYSNFFKFLLKVKKFKFPIIVSIAFGYVIIALLLFYYYNEKVKNTKSLFLSDNYELILETGLNRFRYLTSKSNIDLQSSHISLNDGYIEFCENKKCLDYNLHKFQSLLEKSIPNFNNFKIDLNNNILYSNSVSENYEIEKIYYLNQDNKLVISLSIDDKYWNQTAQDIREPFWIIISFISFSFIVICYLYRVLSIKLEQEYQDKHDDAVRNCEKKWITKLWNIEFNKVQDVEINYFFSQEAAKIKFLNENILFAQYDNVINFKKSQLEEKSYYSISLYNLTHKEEVSIRKLIKIFTSRFEKENDNISFNIFCSEKHIYFSSVAAFYQVIYSVIIYLFFIIKKQYCNGKHEINLFISNVSGKLFLNFSYSGMPIEKEKDLFRMSNEFIKTHANPFILNIEQVFKLLKLNGFNCKIGYDKSNNIEVSEKVIRKNKIVKNSRDNLIYLDNWNKEE